VTFTGLILISPFAKRCRF